MADIASLQKQYDELIAQANEIKKKILGINQSKTKTIYILSISAEKFRDILDLLSDTEADNMYHHNKNYGIIYSAWTQPGYRYHQTTIVQNNEKDQNIIYPLYNLDGSSAPNILGAYNKIDMYSHLDENKNSLNNIEFFHCESGPRIASFISIINFRPVINYKE